jgi:hypothetical protein
MRYSKTSIIKAEGKITFAETCLECTKKKKKKKKKNKNTNRLVRKIKI